MNNGKVRIYELSKDLGLENKDILTVCERLGISAKSHSSTITDDDALRIRNEVKQTSGKLLNKPSKPSPPRPRKPNATAKETPRPAKKQQILEIRRHRPKPAKAPIPPKSETASTADVQSPAPSDLAASPSRPEASRSSAPLPKPKLKRPGSPEPSESAALQSPDASPEIASPTSPVVEDSSDKGGVELIQPPARPSKPERPTRPVLKKRDRADSDRRDSDAPRQPRIEIREIDEDEDNTPQLKPKPELRRPRPKRSDAVESDDTQDSEETAVPSGGVTEEPILRRPSPPRQKRKNKEREEEEQEQQKTTKSKNKRRSHDLLKDDDEDILADLDEVTGDGSDSSATAALSMSLARPPKPKSKASPKPPSTSKTQKPQQRDSSRNQRRDRRNQPEEQERPEIITLTGGLSVHELANLIMVPETEIIKLLFFKGIATNINQTLDLETAKMVAEEFEILVETAEEESEAKKVTEMLDVADLENLSQRPPVVTIMGHVDHGKTTLLDSIRKTKVAQGEAGGITQHIGAYHVDVEHDGQNQQIVFLDTPGHEAFTAMRARGARVTDIAILVVAADDGVRPQTIEAISHAKAAEVPIVVAVNKIDKETAQPDRVKQELMEHGLVPEEWGGETIMVPVSAINGDNLDTLLEMLLLVSEVEDLNANPDRLARGTVIEANLDKSRGPVASLLVQNGTLRVGDSIVAGSVFGKVRAMIDDRGDRVNEATPSFAVEVLGLNDVPAAGDEFEVFADERAARSIADSRSDEQRRSRLQQAMASRRVTLSSLSAQAQEGDLKELNIILKADVQGSVEAILAALQQLPQNEVQIRVLLGAPGEISETDVDLAAASGAVLIGFNTTLAPGARQAADRQGVDVRDYDIIYNLLDDIQGAMEGLLEPELVEEPLGEVEVRAVFPVRRGSVAGCYVLSGKVTRNCRIRVNRGSEVVYEGNLDSLKRMKDDVKEVASGFECGIGVDNFNGWKEGDIIRAFKLVTQRRKLSPV
ncbi:translation initiation factor IF-2 [Oscillatoria sp. CS-180]|uniref:translation initiation factor IF-2 n=1 Tax=Oscillatoria sp. CS-180 TaxID=3021720 RepID=UPI00232ED0AB|nr:translation initiation factor IF-2 [Oscillatoria sp. CS-180]MDB9529856.1 translation initiation factor IF-2 [Oscillatoria sp. CS-180]